MDYFNKPIEEDFSSEIEFQRVQDAVRRRKRRRLALTFGSLALSVGIVAGGVFFVDRRLTGGELFAAPRTVSRFVPNGDKNTFIFSDGTAVTVNAGSKISYPERFGLALREVSLDGEAYFEVSKNPHRPFVVTLPGGQKVRVLGTSFNVKAFSSDGSFEVALDQGRVEVCDERKTYSIAPGEALTYDRSSGRASIVRCNTSTMSAWTRNTISFHGAPIDEIAEGLSRLFDVKVYIAPEVDRTRLYTFSAKRSDLDLILKELQIIAPIRIRRSGDDILISE